MTGNPPAPACPPVAIILVNWNGWRDCIECIHSLLAQSYASLHIFVIDNDSRDGSVDHLSAWCDNPRADPSWPAHDGVGRVAGQAAANPIVHRVLDQADGMFTPPPAGCSVTLVRAGANLGFAGGCNVGFRVAGLDSFGYFWLLNTDTVAHRDALAALVHRARGDARIGMVGSTLRYYDRPHVVQSLGGARMEMATVTSRLIGEGGGLELIPASPEGVEREMFYVMGASMLVSATFIREVGLMQEDYFLYYEEIDWAMRGRNRFKLAYAPSSHVFHKSGASSSKVLPALTATFYYRNRLRFVTRFFPERLGAAKRGLAIDLLRHLLKGRWALARVVASALWNAPQIIRSAQA